VALPAQPTPLLGRGRELEAVRELLLTEHVRLVTLVGPGGAGKTRLAVAVAETVSADFAHGVVFVDLSAATAASEVAPTIARGLALPDLGSQVRMDRIARFILDRQLLLVLDNFEHVVAAAPQIAELLADCPELKVLATSRAPLRVRWEYEFALGPLQLPPPSVDGRAADLAAVPSVSLFVARARAARPDFSLTDQNGAAVAAICRRLDGMPLAIELAAVRIKLLSPAALLARLDHRLSLLTDGARELPRRLRSLRGALDWSFELLTPAQQSLFRTLAVFSGGFSVCAAQAVCRESSPEDVFDGLAALVDQQLVQVRYGADGDSRFDLLDTVHEYALERLSEAGEVDDARQRHAQIFLELAESSEPRLASGARDDCLRQLDLEYENLRAALTWLVEKGSAAQACRLVGALCLFWVFDERVGDGRRWVERCLDISSAHEVGMARAKALQTAGHLAWVQGDNNSARRRLKDAVSVAHEYEDRATLAVASLHLAFVLEPEGDATAEGERARLLDEALQIFREVGDDWGTARVLLADGQIALDEGKRESGRRTLEQSLGLWQRVGDAWFTAHTLNVLGDVARAEAMYDRAFDLYSRSLALLRQQEARTSLASVLQNLGYLAFQRQQQPEAVRQFSEALDLFSAQADYRGMAECLLGLALTLDSVGRPSDAARLFGAAEVLLASAGAAPWPINVEPVQRARAHTRMLLGDARFAELAAEGGGSSLARVLRLVRETVDSLSAPPATRTTPLTPREQEIAALLARGYTNRQLAETLVLSEQTVETHVKRILGKLELHSRHQLAHIQIPT